MKHNYSVYLLWSQEDQAFLAQVIELPGCLADGATREEALQNLEVIVEEWIETAKEEGRKIPEPLDSVRAEQASNEFNERVEQHVRREVETAVKRVLEDLARFQTPMSLAHQTNDPAEWWKRTQSSEK